MTMFVKIKKGFWRNNLIEDKVFPVHQKYDPIKGYVIVKGSESLGVNNANCRINVIADDIEYIDSDGNPYVETFKVGDIIEIDYEKRYLDSESEEEAKQRISNTFCLFSKVVESVADGKIKGLIVSGPPGIGKTFTVEECMGDKFGYNSRHYEIVKGFASPLAIYKTLHDNSSKNNIVVFDDCDDAFNDERALNILKCALDTGSRRTICWLSDCASLKAADIPDRFEFNGGIIFLTNTDFEKCTSTKLRPHLDAMMSRCHYLDLEISSIKDQLLRIKQIVDAGMLDDYEFDEWEKDEVMNFVYENFNFLRERSLRIVKKIADVYVAQPDAWQQIAESTCLRKSAKFERLYKQKLSKDSVTFD